MARCESCLYKAEVADGICPVCGIAQAKSTKELTKAEKKIRYAARGIRAVSVLHTLGGIIMLLAFASLLAQVIEDGLGRTGSPALVGATLLYHLVFGVLFLVLAVGLRKYVKWAYYAAAASYGVILAVNLLAPTVSLFVVILCAYYIGNKNARAIFNRTVL